jgi:hypothetical protein
VFPDPTELGECIGDAFDWVVNDVDWNGVLRVWLQPIATVITGLLAVLAAGIAYRAVTRQIEANAKNVQKQIDADASAVSAQIAADRSERRRAERIDVATRGATLVAELTQIAFAYEHYSGKAGASPSPNLQQLEKEKFYGLEVLSATLRMQILGMPDSSKAVEAVYEQARLVIDPLPSAEAADASTVEEKKVRALSTLKASLEQEVTPARIKLAGQ